MCLDYLVIDIRVLNFFMKQGSGIWEGLNLMGNIYYLRDFIPKNFWVGFKFLQLFY